MAKTRVKRAIEYWLITMVLLLIFSVNPWKIQASDLKMTSSDGNFANVVVYVNFADTTHEHGTVSFGNCFLENPNIEELFDGTEYPRSLTQYLKTISYGELNVCNLFPQYDSSTEKITPYQLHNNADYYAENYDALVSEVADLLIADNKIPAGVSIDRDGDYCLDNLMIVIPCEEGISNTLFYGISSQYAGMKALNGKTISHYNLVTEGRAYFGISESGQLIHEFLHTLGYPDLYRNANAGTTYAPVGAWDIMSTVSTRVQYPLAYYRSTISNWFTIPTVTSNQTGYSLVAASATNNSNKNNQAVILKTSHSDSEFFVLEYRKKGDSYVSGSLDASVYGNGLIIYRINTDQKSNYAGDAWAAYVFRPGDSYSNGLELASNTEGQMMQSFLSLEENRTSYGSALKSATLSDSAITYSDGTNSGIVISNVGSAQGDVITFDISFAEPESDDATDWTILTDGRSGEYTKELGSFMDADGIIYCVETNATGTPEVYSFDGANWTKVCDAPAGAKTMPYELGKYNQILYCAYVDDSYYLHLVKRSGNSWANVYTSAMKINYFSLASDSYGLTLSFVDIDGMGVYNYLLSASGNGLTTVRTSGSYGSNISAAMIDGTPYLAYREYQNQNKIVIWKYTSGSWTNLSCSYTAAVFDITGANHKLYLSAYDGSSNGYLYTYDASESNPSWQKTESPFCSVAISDLTSCVWNGIPYVFYGEGASPYTVRVKAYADGVWTEIGSGVSSGGINGFGLYGYEENLYAVYCRSASNKTFIKKHAAIIIKEATTTIAVDLPSGYAPNLYVDGIAYTTTYDSVRGKYVVDTGTKSAKVVTAYKLNEAGSPLSVYVWTVNYQGNAYEVTALPKFENIIAYNGFSARISGESGLRYKSSISTELKQNLLAAGGVDGYVLKEYGVIALPEAYLSKYPLVCNGTNVLGRVDFKVNIDGSIEQTLFVSENGRDYFTGLLTGIPSTMYKTNVAFRSYLILEKDGKQYTIYQKPQARSLYYISNQYLEKNMYASGTSEYDYLQKIIAAANK